MHIPAHTLQPWRRRGASASALPCAQRFLGLRAGGTHARYGGHALLRAQAQARSTPGGAGPRRVTPGAPDRPLPHRRRRRHRPRGVSCRTRRRTLRWWRRTTTARWRSCGASRLSRPASCSRPAPRRCAALAAAVLPSLRCCAASLRCCAALVAAVLLPLCCAALAAAAPCACCVRAVRRAVLHRAVRCAVCTVLCCAVLCCAVL